MTSAPTKITIPSRPAPPPVARRTSGGWRLAAGIGVLALAAGFGGGYAVGYANRPDPVTTTVTRYVPAAPYSTALTQTVDVTYDGTHAYYAGPAQVLAGTTVTFHVVQDAAHPVGAIAVAKMPDTYTWEEALAYAQDHLFSQPPSDAAVENWTDTSSGDITVTLPAGLHEVVIGLPPMESSRLVPVALILATGSADQGQRAFREG